MGGGNWVTQNYPTRFHEFWTRKILAPGESAEDFKEVTNAQKTSLEASDAARAAEFELMTDEFLARCAEWFGRRFITQSYDYVSANWRYNEQTGFFEFGDLKDITFPQMRLALDYVPLCRNKGTLTSGSLCDGSLRFAIIQYRTSYPTQAMWESGGLQTILMAGTFGTMPMLNTLQSFFTYCTSLKTIIGRINAVYNSKKDVFGSCTALETVRLEKLVASMDFHWSPNLSLWSIEYMIRYSAATSEITITLHPTAYARVTEEVFELAATKNIVLASA